MEPLSPTSECRPGVVLPSRPGTPADVVQHAVQTGHPDHPLDTSALPPDAVTLLTPPSRTRAQSSDGSASCKAQDAQSLLLELNELTEEESRAYKQWSNVMAQLRAENVRYLTLSNERREAAARLAEARVAAGYSVGSEKDDALKGLEDRLAYLNQWLTNVSPITEMLSNPEDSSKHATEIYIARGLFDKNRYKWYALKSSERKVVVKYHLIPGVPSSLTTLSFLPQHLRQARDGLWGNHFEDHWFVLLPEKDYGLLVCRQRDVKTLDEMLNAKTTNSAHLEVTVTRWRDGNRYYVGSFLPLLRWLPFNEEITGPISEVFDQSSFRPGIGECAFKHLKVYWHNKNDLLFCVLEFVKFNQRYSEEIEKFVASGGKAM